MTAIAGEQIIAASAGKQDLDTGVPCQLADKEHVEWRRVRKWLVKVPDHLLDACSHARCIHFHDINHIHFHNINNIDYNDINNDIDDLDINHVHDYFNNNISTTTRLQRQNLCHY